MSPFVTLVCSACGCVIEVYNPTLEDLHEPLCDSCKEQKQEREERYALSRSDA